MIDRAAPHVVLLLLSVALFSMAGSAVSAEEITAAANSQEETIPPLTPEAALATIQVPEGFHVSLFAGEPAVQNPIAMCTDLRGRLWVAENYTYAESALNFNLNFSDRIVILADTNGDGVHDERRVFWDQGKKLTSVAVGLGGVWVTCAPHLLFIPDANGDDIPDGEPVVMLEGFDADAVRHNIVNGLKWGPDGWLYGRHGILATSLVGVPGSAPAERVALNCSVWRFHPTTHDFEVVATGTTNPWGMDWDSRGECWLINTVIGHLWHVVPGVHWRRMYGTDFNPHLYELVEQTADHVHWNTEESWSDIREGMSSTTDAAGGGHAHSGLIYCDATWPEEYYGSLVAGNYHGRRLNRDTLHREGCSFTAHHAPDFFFSGDPYCRIIEMVHARDGGIFVADWSDIGECHDNDGVHRTSGRIFKLTWDGMAGWQHDRRDAPGVPASEGRDDWPVVAEATRADDLLTLPATQLAALQRHPAEWYARAARLALQQRHQAGENLSEAVTALEWMLAADEGPIVTLRAMWGLHVIDRLPRAELVRLYNTSTDESVRGWALRLIVERGESPADDVELLGVAAAEESSGLVRLTIASLLQGLATKDRLYVATNLAKHGIDAHDRQQPLLIWYGIEPAVVELPEAAVELAARTNLQILSRFIARRLTSELRTRPQGAELLVELLEKAPANQHALRQQVLIGMTEALRGWRKAAAPGNWPTVIEHLTRLGDEETVRLARELSVVFGDGRAIDELRQVVQNNNASADERRAAIRSLVEARDAATAPLLTGWLDNRDLQVEALRGLAAMGGADAPRLITERYGRFQLAARVEALTTLVSRPDFAPALLDAVEKNEIPRGDVPSFQLRQMQTYGDEALARRVRDLFPELQQLAESKQQRIAELKGLLTDDLLATADPSHGRLLFQEACAKCHKLFGTGGATAPELTGAQRTNLHYLLENILDPSATISKNFQMSIVALDDGRVLNGIVLEQTDRTLTLQTPTEALTLDRDSIEVIRETNLSLMPEGQLDRMTTADIRDLIGYLMSPQQVALPQTSAAGE